MVTKRVNDWTCKLDPNSLDGTPLHRAAYPELYIKPKKIKRVLVGTRTRESTRTRFKD